MSDVKRSEEEATNVASSSVRSSWERLRPASSSAWLFVTIAAAIFVGILVFAWQMIPRDPGNASPEAGFLRDMQTHHSQAVQMAMIIRDRTSDEQLRFLTTDMAFAQSQESGLMQGYLDAWGLPFGGPDAPMSWMDHPLADGELMPGMATDEQIAQLSTLPVDQAEVLFLQLMIRHHQGGVEMAEALLARSDNDLVRSLAERIVRIQTAEIATMNQFLVDRGQPPITDPLPESHDHTG